MTARKTAGIDRKALYIPKPSEWDFRKLDPAEVERRLTAARGSVGKLDDWAGKLHDEREGAKRELWDRLPTAKLYEQQTKLARLEDMGKQLAQIAKLRAQIATAIEYIEKRLCGAGVVN